MCLRGTKRRAYKYKRVLNNILINYLTNPEAREEWVHKKDSLVISQNGSHLHFALLIYFTIFHPSFFPLFPTLAALPSYLLAVYSSHSSLRTICTRSHF